MTNAKAQMTNGGRVRGRDCRAITRFMEFVEFVEFIEFIGFVGSIEFVETRDQVQMTNGHKQSGVRRQ